MKISEQCLKHCEDLKAGQVCPPIKNTDDTEMISTSVKNTAADTAASVHNGTIS